MTGAWFRRRDEGPAPRTGPEPGVRLTHPDGTAFWFPGATPAAALVLARAAVPPEVFACPETLVEFGTRDGRRFAASEVLQGKPRGGGPNA